MRTEDEYDWLFEDSHQEDISEPIEETKSTDSCRLKVGDKVKILHNPDRVPGRNYIGQTGIIMKDDKSDMPFYIKLEDGDTWWFKKDYVEPFEKRKLKVGDKVRIKSKEWYDENKDQYGEVDVFCTFTPEMSKYCGEVFEIAFIKGSERPIYKLKGTSNWSFSEEMFDL